LAAGKEEPTVEERIRAAKTISRMVDKIEISGSASTAYVYSHIIWQFCTWKQGKGKEDPDDLIARNLSLEDWADVVNDHLSFLKKKGDSSSTL
jgi:hypothetical protein